MRRFTFCLVLILACLISAFTQSGSKADSLFNMLKRTNPDSVKIKLYLSIGDIYENISLDSALFFYTKAFEISEGYSISKGSKNYLQFPILSLKAAALRKLGDAYDNKGNFDLAIKYYLLSLQISENLNDTIFIATCFKNLGVIYDEQGNYNIALDYYFRALKIFEQLGYKKGISACYNDIGNIHAYQNDYNDALSYFSKSLEIKEELGDKRGIALCNGNIGAIYISIHKYELATGYYIKSLKARQELGDKKGVAICYDNMGVIQFYEGNLQDAIICYEKSLNLYREINDREGISISNGNIAEAYNKMKKYEVALIYGKESLESSKEIGALPWQRQAYENLSISYEGLKDFRNALFHYRQFKLLNDSIFNTEKQKQIARMEAIYLGDKKQKEIEILEKDKRIKIDEIRKEQLQKYGLVFGFLLMILLVAVIFRSNKRKQKDNLLLARQKIELERINQSKNEILGIVAHDLRNPIGNINAFSKFIIDDNMDLDPDQKVQLLHIQELSEYMLHLVNNLLDISVIESGVLKLDCTPLNYVSFIEEEVLNNAASAAQHNIKIEFQSVYKNIQVNFDKTRMQQVINNLLSNAIKFSKNGDVIKVTISANDTSVITSVRDFGPGIAEENYHQIFKKFIHFNSSSQRTGEGTGLGLSIVNGIVSAHGGRIYVQSVLNEGSDFIYELPLTR